MTNNTPTIAPPKTKPKTRENPLKVPNPKVRPKPKA